LAIDLPVAVGAAVLATFALLHGHAHGTEMMSTLRGLEYMVGFVVATATLHALGIGFALTLQRAALRPVVRLTGLACIAFGLGWFNGVLE
jgi:urease accessory protein